MGSDDVLKLCNDEKSLQMLEESMYRGDEEMLKGYRYHLNLIKLLALCVEGRNGNTILKCQSMITLEDLAKVLCNSSITNAEVIVCLFVCLFIYLFIFCCFLKKKFCCFFVDFLKKFFVVFLFTYLFTY